MSEPVSDTIDTLLTAAQQALDAGAIERAEQLSGEILALVPRHPMGLYFSGLAAALRDDPATAAARFQAAIAVGGGMPTCHYNLGQALHRLGDLAGAERAYLATILRAPGFAEAYHGLGITLTMAGRTDDAIAAFQRAVHEKPDYPEARHNLASVLVSNGQAIGAFALYRDWLASDPGNQHLLFLTGTAALTADRLDDAEQLLRQFLLRQPRDTGAYNNLGLVLVRKGRVSEAIAVLHKAVDIFPDNKGAWFALGAAYQATGQVAESAHAYERAREIGGEDLGADSNILMALNYSDALSPREIYGRHRRWGESYVQGEVKRPTVPALGGRRLRIGYVSPDFRLHSVAMFLLPLLEHHDRRRVELFAYANVENCDEITDLVRRQVDHWRPITGVSTADAAALIRRDEVDVLIDLAGHTARHRLDVFALRPAPLQATWLGYPATTGLPTIDIRFTDLIADPPGEADAIHVERLVRLDGGFLCYRPLGPVPAPLPAPVLERGTISFGSFNALSKLNGTTAALWARVLHAVPGSRLVLKTALLADPGVKARVLKLFAGHGIAAARIVMLSHIPHHFGHLSAYGEVDIALDPMPYNGTTTTCEALWSGVPVLTLPGNCHAARVGASLLTAAGLPEWIAADADDFVAKAVGLAADPQGLAGIRSDLRDRLQKSSLCDGSDFTRRFEAKCFEAFASI